MPAPLQHVDVGTLMGSWPFIPNSTTAGVTLQSRALTTQATILGTRRETGSGYSVVGLTFFLWVDDNLGVPQQYSISFTDPGPGYLTLDEVITQINTGASPALPQPVAFKDNGFLRITSPNTGEDSYLRTQRDPSSTAVVFLELGLFAEIEARGGALSQTPTVDPDRQTITPGQLSWAEGEPFEARVFNRMAFQLGVNTDRVAGIVDRKRMAVRQTLDVGSYVLQNPNDEGVQLSGFIHTGDIVTPSKEQLENQFAVLDNDGREFMKRQETVLDTQVSGTGASIFTDPNTHQTMLNLGSSPAFIWPLSDTNDDAIYVRIDNVPGFASLNNVLLVVLIGTGTSLCFVSVIDPATGGLVELDPSVDLDSSTIERVESRFLRCMVDGVYDVQGGTRVEGVLDVRQASVSVSRVELNNRIFCSGAQFITGTKPVVVGDVVNWTGHGVPNPYTNNGDYRVQRIIDDETLEIVAEDWGPVFLNSDTGGGLGSIVVTTDGEFWDSPFVRFSATGSIPDAGDSFRVVYRGMGSIRSATDDPIAITGGSLRFSQEADDTIQRAIRLIVGPSATSIDDFVKGGGGFLKGVFSLEEIWNAWEGEHNFGGKHAFIQPDKIDMDENISGVTVIIRNANNSEGSNNVKKLQFYDSSAPSTPGTQSDDNFHVLGNGYLGIDLHQTPNYARQAFHGGIDDAFAISGPTISFGGITAWVRTGGTLAADTYYYRIQPVDWDGNFGPMNPTEILATVNGSQRVDLSWSKYHIGAKSWRVWRGTSSGVYTDFYDVNDHVPGLSDDGTVAWSSGSSGVVTDNFYYSLFLSGDDTETSWFPNELAVGGQLTLRPDRLNDLYKFEASNLGDSDPVTPLNKTRVRAQLGGTDITLFRPEAFYKAEQYEQLTTPATDTWTIGYEVLHAYKQILMGPGHLNRPDDGQWPGSNAWYRLKFDLTYPQIFLGTQTYIPDAPFTTGPGLIQLRPPAPAGERSFLYYDDGGTEWSFATEPTNSNLIFRTGNHSDPALILESTVSGGKLSITPNSASYSPLAYIESINYGLMILNTANRQVITEYYGTPSGDLFDVRRDGNREMSIGSGGATAYLDSSVSGYADGGTEHMYIAAKDKLYLMADVQGGGVRTELLLEDTYASFSLPSTLECHVKIDGSLTIGSTTQYGTEADRAIYLSEFNSLPASQIIVTDLGVDQFQLNIEARFDCRIELLAQTADAFRIYMNDEEVLNFHDYVGNHETFVFRLGSNPGSGSTWCPIALNHSDVTGSPAAALRTANPDCAWIFARSNAGVAELWGSDEGGVTSKLTPHDPETFEWVNHSQIPKLGIERIIRVEKAIRALEKLTGEKFIEDSPYEEEG